MSLSIMHKYLKREQRCFVFLLKFSRYECFGLQFEVLTQKLRCLMKLIDIDWVLVRLQINYSLNSTNFA